MIAAAAALPDNPTLSARSLRKSYGRRVVVEDVSFDVGQGEVVGLLGPNGAGKSTSFHMVAGLVLPDSGEVSLGGKSLTGLPLYRRARAGLGYLPQEASIFRGMTVLQNLLAVLEGMKLPKAEQNARAEELLGRFHLTHLAQSRGGQLSGGERRRAEIARALCTNPTHLLFDEPFAGVDPIAVADIQKVIRDVKAAGPGILITDHNVRETLDVCDRAYLISRGKILMSGTPGEIRESPIARKVYLGEGFSMHA